MTRNILTKLHFSSIIGGPYASKLAVYMLFALDIFRSKF